MNSDAQLPGTERSHFSAKRVFIVVVLLANLLYSTLALAQVLGTGHLNIERRSHTATLLENENVLIVGGDNQNGMVSQAEIFDPVSKTSALAAALMTPRTDHTANRLSDGRVLVIGGRDHSGSLQSTEIYNPLTTSFVAGPAMMRARSGHTATMLRNDRILVVGGDLFGSAEIYDPISQSFSLVTGSLKAPRKFHSAILLQNGQVMIVGGVNAQDNVLNTAEVFDPASQSFYLPPTDMQTARAFATLKLLPDGKVQIIGGDAELSMEVFDPADGIFIAKALLPPNADLLGATLSTQSRAALFSPSISQDPLLQGILTTEQLSLLDRTDQSITELPSRNQALVAGGLNSTGQVLNSAKLVSSSTASVTTDKTDYAPGQIVTITGSGFQPNEQVYIYFHEFPEEYPDVFLSAVANQQGNFVVAEFAPQEIDLGRIFTLTAIGQNSGFTAQTSFKDDNRVRFADTAGGAELTTFGSINVNQCRSAFVQTRQGGTLDNADGNRVVNLSSTPVGAIFFSSSNCTGSPVASVTITEGTQSKQFSFSIGTTGSFAITGDAVEFTGANDATAMVTVQAAPLRTTATNVSCSPGTVPVNSSTNCTATVADTDTGPTSTPTGTITVSLPGGDSGSFSSTTCTLNGGSCSVTYTPGTVGDGAHSIGVSYSGSSTHTSSSDPTPFNVTVNKRPITITADAKIKFYGDADPALTYEITSGSLKSGDTITGALTRAAGENFGTYAISQGTLAISDGNSGNNYDLTFVGALLTITKRPASVTPNAASKIYGDADPALSGTLGGFLSADGVTASYSRTAGETVGTYTISATLSPGAVLGNYEITYNTALFTINKKAASVTPNAANKLYGETDPTLTGTLTGFLPADSVTAIYSRTAGETVAASPYTISGVLSPAAVLGNYEITYNTALFTINKRPASVTPNTASKIYGDADPALSGMLSAFLSADGVTASYSRTAGETVGTYTISATLSPGGVLGNYEITYNTALFTINKRPVTVTADAQSKTYGEADPALTYQITSGSLAFSDVFMGALSRIPGELVGTYAIQQNTLSITNVSNYTFTYIGANLTITTGFAFNGFYSPIGGSVENGNGGSYADPVKTFKLGSTIPVKFGATWLNGGAALITGLHTLQAVKYNNATDSASPIDATPTDAATDGNQFRLTTTDWHFNLSTKVNKFSAGTWLLIATLEDGSKHSVWISIKK